MSSLTIGDTPIFNSLLHAKDLNYTDTNRAPDTNFTIDLSTACTSAGIDPSKVVAMSYNGFVPSQTNGTQAYLRGRQYNPPRASLFTWRLSGASAATTQTYIYMFTVFYTD